MGLTALDIIVLLLVVGGAVLGALRGFTREVIAIATWIAVILALKLLHTPATAALEGTVGTWAGAAVLAFALIALVVYVAGRVLAGQLGAGVRASLLGPVDRLLGFGFGAVKGLLAATLLFLLANLGYDTIYGAAAARPDWMASSGTYTLLDASGRAVVDFVETRRHAGADAADAGDEGRAENAADAR